MRIRRRRKPNVAWLPALGVEAEIEQDPFRVAALTGFIDVDATSHIQNLILPLTYDEPRDRTTISATEATMADFQESGYRLRRVVGSCMVSRGEDGTGAGQGGYIPAILVGCGLAVLAWDETAGAPFTQVDTLGAQWISEPWIWRRVWTLGTWGIGAAYGPQRAAYTNRYFSSDNSPQSRGEFIDQKTARTIKEDERLCFIMSTCPWPPLDYSNEDPAVLPTSIVFTLDYRLLASMLRNSGNRGRGTAG